MNSLPRALGRCPILAGKHGASHRYTATSLLASSTGWPSLFDVDHPQQSYYGQGRHVVVRHFTAIPQTSESNEIDKIVDLRSDTVTSPSRPMLEAAMDARTGDDVMGEDPTVHELQDYVADLFGKEQGLFVPTGTMSNLIAIMAHCHGRASEIILGSQSHICLWEGGGAAGLGSVHTRQIQECPTTAQFDLQDIRDAYRIDDDDHCAHTKVLCIENTHNMMGGAALPISYMNELGNLTKELGIALHVDGARIFNASTALNVSVQELCKDVDTISICLSKGLGAPLGSILVGPSEFIRLAKRARKRCGGGMRQAGVVAAMGLHAIQNNVQRLTIDHERAQWLAHEISQQAGFRVARNGQVDTNMFFFRLPESCSLSRDEFQQRLATEYGIKIGGGYSRGGQYFRAVTHLDLTDNDMTRAAHAMIHIVQ